MLAGAFILITGVLIYFFNDKLNWLGRLPGDIRMERNSFRFYFPLTTMILLSLFLSALIALVKKIW